jgi:putative membrane protein
MSDERDSAELARRLVYLAAERTLTSWVRTVLSLMALGFVIDRFGLIVDLMPGASTASRVYSRALWTVGGSTLIGMGVAMALFAGFRYLRFAIAYNREGTTRVRHGILIGVAFTLLLGLVGIVLIVLLTAILK